MVDTSVSWVLGFYCLVVSVGNRLGKFTGIINNYNEKGKSDLHPETRVDKEVCYSWNVEQGRFNSQTWPRVSRVRRQGTNEEDCTVEEAQSKEEKIIPRGAAWRRAACRYSRGSGRSLRQRFGAAACRVVVSDRADVMRLYGEHDRCVHGTREKSGRVSLRLEAFQEGTFVKIFKVTEKSIGEDRLVKRMDRNGCNNLGVEHFISTELDGLRP